MSTASEPPIDKPAEPPSTLHRAKVNAAYLVYGSKAAVAPASLTTRSALTTTRYVLRYVVRRLLRYTKYALIGGCLAVLGGGLLGTIGSGLAFFAAPSIGVGMGIGVITAILKFGWRHRGNHFRGGIWDGWQGMKTRAQQGKDGAEDEELDATSAEEEQLEAENRATRRDVWMRV
ncbi:hypothetical protein C343_04862 [Cryptococcus neoformans C23]|uniref:Transmembrane protein n=1 Tax=Cryptococcus neoformans (strain H99 / ATCC 208821 / CBS 10515 / FGSC 9487) TaxID=235443 RepID=J9VVT9_CRYN9|nr:hypothetical protein CNAG_03511 [Cryptococcus neoformans var. grubii H99]AUB26686.1 hypothetical protein CKF44_03511 [Cryptococcus neoformans var. grubii]OWZ29826.1 hypothetical protein C347_04908 [Cryptococcus neoformans var. grubii AD2-60a]OWZ41700.1 hypothetical protein C343_04862 [Cryptococcus neoformans var. grubii C23]OXC83090.1 hypothetical protein C344_04587 [Cryptococcus neoformans var. grubii AD1-7a]AFR96734.1 hypothetical protein CNAG_03511 [Cryptococcus neoformans var. grubii H9|eukprot:XP_012051306.1 hypothetical protein CNAG_03511 [Cryptococcus neoformans var. grubii H99]